MLPNLPLSEEKPFSQRFPQKYSERKPTCEKGPNVTIQKTVRKHNSRRSYFLFFFFLVRLDEIKISEI
jgi:hypothetical protein